MGKCYHARVCGHHSRDTSDQRPASAWWACAWGSITSCRAGYYSFTNRLAAIAFLLRWQHIRLSMVFAISYCTEPMHGMSQIHGLHIGSDQKRCALSGSERERFYDVAKTERLRVHIIGVLHGNGLYLQTIIVAVSWVPCVCLLWSSIPGVPSRFSVCGTRTISRQTCPSTRVHWCKYNSCSLVPISYYILHAVVHTAVCVIHV